MTYTNEQIEAMASGCDQCGDPAVGEMLLAWIAERKKTVVTDEMVECVAEALRENGWASGGEYVEDFLPDVRAALEAALKEMQK